MLFFIIKANLILKTLPPPYARRFCFPVISWGFFLSCLRFKVADCVLLSSLVIGDDPNALLKLDSTMASTVWDAFILIPRGFRTYTLHSESLLFGMRAASVNHEKPFYTT